MVNYSDLTYFFSFSQQFSSKMLKQLKLLLENLLGNFLSQSNDIRFHSKSSFLRRRLNKRRIRSSQDNFLPQIHPRSLNKDIINFVISLQNNFLKTSFFHLSSTVLLNQTSRLPKPFRKKKKFKFVSTRHVCKERN